MSVMPTDQNQTTPSMPDAGGEKRYVADCRKMPSEKNCSLTIAGTKEEVMRVAKRHAVEDHGHQDTPELEQELESGLAEE